VQPAGELHRQLGLGSAVAGEPTGVTNKGWLCKRLAWRLQALAEGDLSERARRRASELACDADLRLLPPRRAIAVANLFSMASAGAAWLRSKSPSRRKGPRA